MTLFVISKYNKSLLATLKGKFSIQTWVDVSNIKLVPQEGLGFLNQEEACNPIICTNELPSST